MVELSVIVPVYNVERYLKHTLDSILSQTFTDFELILIDDGSTDQSGNICDIAGLADKRVRVVHQNNRGMSAARNLGLTLAKGSIIGFVDSDDLIAPDMYQNLIEALHRFNADISICGLKEIRSDQKIPVHSGSWKLYSSKAIMELILKGKKLSVNVQSRVYRSEIFQGIRFPEGMIAEDAAVLAETIGRSHVIVFNNQPKYYYVRHSGSATTRPFALIDLTSIKVWTENERIISNKWPDLSNLAHMRVISSYFYVLDKIMLLTEWYAVPSLPRVIKFLKANARFILRSSEFTSKRKLSVILLLLSQHLYRLLVKLQHRSKDYKS